MSQVIVVKATTFQTFPSASFSLSHSLTRVVPSSSPYLHGMSCISGYYQTRATPMLVESKFTFCGLVVFLVYLFFFLSLSLVSCFCLFVARPCFPFHKHVVFFFLLLLLCLHLTSSCSTPLPISTNIETL